MNFDAVNTIRDKSNNIVAIEANVPSYTIDFEGQSMTIGMITDKMIEDKSAEIMTV